MTAPTVELVGTYGEASGAWLLLEVGPIHPADAALLQERFRVLLEDRADGIGCAV